MLTLSELRIALQEHPDQEPHVTVYFEGESTNKAEISYSDAMFLSGFENERPFGRLVPDSRRDATMFERLAQLTLLNRLAGNTYELSAYSQRARYCLTK